MKFLTPGVHGMIDYAAAIGLIAFPFVLGFEGFAFVLSVAGGIGLLLYSLITDYALSAAKMLPMRVHLAIDGMAALVFLIAPFLFGWTGLVQAYYLVMGAAVALVVATTQVPEREVARAEIV